ncbi:helix-turn-helix transcriptional regulator [Paralysiella testudinis]|uniref:AlpA family phage regulatory protein n=1 Tax=Paralysiella testudinis TaxID=2809020 RepID=A0A892ZCU0_9NEIS|nr:AlpA family phage regulatory protein [Paralysiella testudinis]QRQ80851.1 AlpA family phage regulatory protein [Paralysiella testudinis]
MQPEIKILRITALANKLSISRSTIYDWLNPHSPRFDESFPKPIKLGQSSTGWLSNHVDDWLQAKFLEQHSASEDLQ